MGTDNESEEFTSKDQHLSIDVVCGMDLVTEKTNYSSTFRDTVYHFCSANCKKHFDDNPERYVGDA
jgi:YHS domain-containing protein